MSDAYLPHTFRHFAAVAYPHAFHVMRTLNAVTHIMSKADLPHNTTAFAYTHAIQFMHTLNAVIECNDHNFLVTLIFRNRGNSYKTTLTPDIDHAENITTPYASSSLLTNSFYISHLAANEHQDKRKEPEEHQSMMKTT
mgnify:CR=1 FL=1